MKRPSILFGALFMTAGLAFGHGTAAVQTEQEALKKLVPALDPASLSWQEVADAALPKVERLKKLAHAEVAAAQGGAVHLGRFTVMGDWGPVQGVAALQDGKVLG